MTHAHAPEAVACTHRSADALFHASPQKSMGAMAEGDTDEFKRVLLEGNPFFLGLTFCVSLLHSVTSLHLTSCGRLRDGDSHHGEASFVALRCVLQMENTHVGVGSNIIWQVALLGVHAPQVFDMLAFKNDIGFWKNKQNVEGLSIKVRMLMACLHMSCTAQRMSQYMW
jgi:Cleft lip and palate transmembrane protein 1 (CLPTM1)